MKVPAERLKVCDKCKVIRRNGRVMVICEEPSPQAAPGLTLVRRHPNLAPPPGLPDATPGREDRGPTWAVGPMTTPHLRD